MKKMEKIDAKRRQTRRKPRTLRRFAAGVKTNPVILFGQRAKLSV
jgi:hypothetical protein